MTAKFYELSGRLSPRHLPAAMLSLGAGTWALGFVLAKSRQWTDNDLLHTLALLVFVLLVAATCALVIQIGRIRSAVMGYLVGGAAGILTCYFTTLYLVRDLHPAHPVLFAPGALWQWLQAVYAKGQSHYVPVSRILETGQHVDYEVPGGVYAAALFLVIGGLIGAWVALRRSFYCERCGVWLEERASIDRVVDLSDDAARARVSRGDIEPLLAQGLASAEAEACCEVHFCVCPKDESHALLWVGRESRDGKRRSSEIVLRPAWIEGEPLSRLRERAKAWSERG